jgi:flagellin-like protein
MKTNDIGKMTRRRRAQRIRKGQAVSPVVATLILILVAVAAAAALYLWLVAWQGGVTKTVGSPTTQYTIAIGGSTTVFPVTEKAIPWFEANNSGIKVSDNQGGSGAGELALCSGSGAIDIAAMSRPMKSAELALCPTAVQTVIGYDSVVATVTAATVGGVTNNAGVVSFGEGELLAIFWQNGGQPAAAAGFPVALGAPGVAATLVGSPGIPASSGVPAYWGLETPTVAGNIYAWSNVPQHVCFDGAVPATNIDANGFLTGTYTGPCHSSWTYSATDTNAVKLYGRADNSGTEEAFDNNVLGISCGTDNQLASCGFPYNSGAPTTGTINVASGNPAVLALFQKDKEALAIGSWGLNGAPTSQGGGAAGTPQAVVVSVPLMGNSQTGAVTPTLSTIKAGIAAGYGVQVAGGYIGWRPLQYVTLGAPTGEPLRFIDFVLQPSNNQILLESNYYISIDQ